MPHLAECKRMMDQKEKKRTKTGTWALMRVDNTFPGVEKERGEMAPVSKT